MQFMLAIQEEKLIDPVEHSMPLLWHHSNLTLNILIKEK